MNPSNLRRLNYLWTARYAIPLVLWALLWFGLSSGRLEQLFNSDSTLVFLQRLRAILPLVAGGLAMTVIITKMYRGRSNRSFFFSPLGLAAVYGLVGVVSAFLSPSGREAIYWTMAYLSVPLVLWAVVWGRDALEQARRLVQFNVLILVTISGALFVFALVELDLGRTLLDPASWADCRLGQPWLRKTMGVIRPTGVGRFAAVVAVVAVAGALQRNWRLGWVIVLLVSLMLLYTSGARTSMAGFVLGSGLVLLVYGGRKTIIIGLLAIAVLAPVVFGTGLHSSFLKKCIFVEWGRAPIEKPVSGLALTNSLPDRNEPVPEQPPSNQLDLAEELRLRLGVPEGQEANTSGGWRIPLLGRIPEGWFTFSGRTMIWSTSWKLFNQSPVLGSGFHADRLIMGQHVHNSYIHSLVQTGVVGGIPFMAALGFTIILLVRVLRNLSRVPTVHRHLVIQTSGVLATLMLRTIFESTGAFYGVDWLILAPSMLYLQVINSHLNPPLG